MGPLLENRVTFSYKRNHDIPCKVSSLVPASENSMLPSSSVSPICVYVYIYDKIKSLKHNNTILQNIDAAGRQCENNTPPPHPPPVCYTPAPVQGPLLSLLLSMLYVHAAYTVCVWDGCGIPIYCAATLRYRLKVKLDVLPGLGTLKPGQPVPVLIL